jgi:fatty acid desaturase
METMNFIIKVIASAVLGGIALVCLLRSLYLVIKSWLVRKESPAHAAARTALTVAALNFLAGAAVSLIVFLWNPVLLLLPVLLGCSLFWAWLVYVSEASPYQLTRWWQKIRKDQSSCDEREE